MPETRFYDFLENKIKDNKSKLLFQKRDGWSWKQITWLDFNAEVKSIASFLLDLGFKNGEQVLMISSNTLECLFAESAIFLLGGCSIPVPFNTEAEKIEEILIKEKVRFIFLSNEGVLNNLNDVLNSNKNIEKIFIFSDFKSNIEDKIINYKTVVKFGFLKAKKLKDELKDFSESVNSDIPAINFYNFDGDKTENKILTQEIFLELLHLTYKKLRFITPEDQSYTYLTSSGSFSKLVNFLPFFIGNRGAIAENKNDFITDVLEVMPSVMFLSREGMKRSVNYLNEKNGSGSLKKSFGGRLKYVFTDIEPEYSVKSRFISDGISVVDLPELATISS
ncbi:MAG: AMP-binding protein [Thermodesulfobacteriota bacterium]